MYSAFYNTKTIRPKRLRKSSSFTGTASKAQQDSTKKDSRTPTSAARNTHDTNQPSPVTPTNNDQNIKDVDTLVTHTSDIIKTDSTTMDPAISNQKLPATTSKKSLQATPSLSQINAVDTHLARRHSKEYSKQLAKNQNLLDSVQALLQHKDSAKDEVNKNCFKIYYYS